MIHSNPIHHHFHLHRLREMTALYWVHSLRATAVTFVIILVPIYLINIGYSLREVLLVYALEGLVWLVLLYPALYLMPKLGANFNMAMGSFTVAGCMAFLVYLPVNRLMILGYILFLSISNLYWFAFRLNFTAVTEGKEAGSKIGFINALFLASHGLAPAIGGVVAQIYGINWAYGVAIVIIIFAGLPLLGKPDIIKWPKPNLSLLNIKKILPDLIANAGSVVDDSVGALVWPLLVFIIIPTYAGVGILSAVMIISAIVISLWVGRREASKGEAHYLKQGSLVVSVTNFLRLLSQSIFQVAGVNLLAGVGQALYITPLASRYYKNATREPTLEYIFAMQVVSALAWMIYPLILVGLTFLMPDKSVLIIGALLAIPATWAIRFIRTG